MLHNTNVNTSILHCLIQYYSTSCVWSWILHNTTFDLIQYYFILFQYCTILWLCLIQFCSILLNTTFDWILYYIVWLYTTKYNNNTVGPLLKQNLFNTTECFSNTTQYNGSSSSILLYSTVWLDSKLHCLIQYYYIEHQYLQILLPLLVPYWIQY